MVIVIKSVSVCVCVCVVSADRLVREGIIKRERLVSEKLLKTV